MAPEKLDITSMFSCKDMVVAITGGGTGMTSSHIPTAFGR